MRRLLVGLVLCASVAHALASFAADDSGYSTKPTYSVALPAPTLSYFTAADAFGANFSGKIDGFPLRSKLLAATNSSVFLQKNFGAGSWLTVGNVVGFNMDPAFIKISPDSAKIALGTGFYKPLYVFPTTTLSVVSPPDLGAAPGTQTYDLSYYDAAWRDSRYLFINSATFDNDAPGSAIFAIDTEAVEPATAVRTVVDHIPGASGGVAFDQQGNLITGNGYTYDVAVAGTGQIKIWSAADVATALSAEPAPLDYLGSGHVLADNVLSAAWLGVDADNNLYVGGGDAFGGSGDYGYAGLISAKALQRALAGGAPVDRQNPGEFTEIAPDPCKNDDATSVLYVPGVEMLSVSYAAGSEPPSCDAIETTGGDNPAHQQLYFPPNAPDTDHDGVPDGADNAYQVPNPEQTDTDGDGYGDVADCDADNDSLTGAAELSLFVDVFGRRQGDAGFEPHFDLDHDGVVGFADFELLRANWGKAAICE
jgi:hypothetical protein